MTGPPDPPDSFGGEGDVRRTPDSFGAAGPAECWEVRSFNKCYIWSGASVVAEYDDNNTLLNNFAYAGGMLVARFKTLTDTASVGYVFGDRSGSARSVVPKSNPSSSWREADYGALGNIIKEQASSPDNCNYLYTGKEWYSDHGINLYYYGARWYDPSIGLVVE